MPSKRFFIVLVSLAPIALLGGGCTTRHYVITPAGDEGATEPEPDTACDAYVACCESMSDAAAASCSTLRSQLDTAKENGASAEQYESACAQALSSAKSAGLCGGHASTGSVDDAGTGTATGMDTGTGTGGCVRKTCTTGENAMCGVISDGCGGTLDCGGCGAVTCATTTCDNNRCVAAPSPDDTYCSQTDKCFGGKCTAPKAYCAQMKDEIGARYYYQRGPRYVVGSLYDVPVCFCEGGALVAKDGDTVLLTDACPTKCENGRRNGVWTSYCY